MKTKKITKKQLMDIAGISNEQEFYKQFPDEGSFYAKYGARLKKAYPGYQFQAQGIGDIMPEIYPTTGKMDFMQKMPSKGTEGLFTQQLDTNKLESMPQSSPKGMDLQGAFGMDFYGKMFQGVSQLIDEKKELKLKRAQNAATSLAKKASSLPSEYIERKYVRPEDAYTTGEQMFPIYGTDTDVLAKSGIHIKPENKGKFNALKKRTGKSTEELTHSKNPLTRKRAIFAQNAKKWKHEDGGELEQYYSGGPMELYEEMDNGGMMQSIQPQVFLPQEQQLIPVNNRIYSKELQFRNNGPTYFEEAERLDTESKALENQLPKAKGKQKQMLNYKINEINRMKDDLFMHQETNKKAEFGEILSSFDSAGGFNKLNSYVEAIGGESGGGTLGEGIGDVASAITGIPGLGTAGKVLGTILDPMPRKIKKQENAIDRNISTIGMNNWAKDRDNPFMKTGGNIRSNVMDGEVNIQNGGAETISYNPYQGETIMFRGPSHAEGGMPLSYGENGVEVEGGEPATKMGNNDLVVFGNIPINKEYSEILGDKNAKGKKFKNYIADLSKEENKATKILDKSMMKLNSLNDSTAYDKLAFSSAKANVLGADMKLKSIADKKQKAADLQKAINDTAEEHGLEGHQLFAKMGKTLPCADCGKTMKAYSGETVGKDKPATEDDYKYFMNLYNAAKIAGQGDLVKLFQEEFSKRFPETAKTILAEYPTTNYGKANNYTFKDLESNYDSWFGKRTERYIPPTDKIYSLNEPIEFPELKYSAPKEGDKTTVTNPTGDVEIPSNLKWQSLFSALPYLRPSDAEDLDPRQLTGELFALATNKEEPVQAQLYHPELPSPYDISLQDQLTAIESDYNAAKRMVNNNPAALAILNSQKYKAEQEVLGEQFRLNQAMKDKVYGENRNLLNQSQLQNLQILDNQYTRQAQAKSNTKAVKQDALASISNKYLQNQLENRTLKTYENLYNYRYDNQGRAINLNEPALFSMSGSGSARDNYGDITEGEALYDRNGRLIKYDRNKKSSYTKTNKDEESRNGSILKAFKTY